MEMARNGKHLEAKLRVVIVRPIGAHLMQGAEQRGNAF